MEHLRADPLTLHYANPAGEWIHGFPLGNGKLGAMVYGGELEERLTLNDDTLWSGQPNRTVRPETRQALEQTRQLLFEGRMKEAQQIVESKMLGYWQESYLPLAELRARLTIDESHKDYSRQLSLRDAVAASVIRTTSGAIIKRTCFVSAPDGALIYRIEADQPHALHLELELTSLLRHEIHLTNDSLQLLGQSPAHVLPHYVPDDDPVRYMSDPLQNGMAFGVSLRVILQDGDSRSEDGRIYIRGSTSATLVVCTATGYRGYAQLPSIAGDECMRQASTWAEAAAAYPFERLLDKHLQDFRGLFDRVTLDLGSSKEACIATRLYQFGRYLLISSSRQGSQPANLQGIWNDQLRAYWSCNWTTNINVQMNYWLAESANLAECHEPLLRLIEELAVTGARVAREYYDCEGWVAHHNVDIWRTASPSAGLGEAWACCSFWPMGGVWLSQHLWEHYAFGRDVTYLKNRAYPVMREAALFCLNWLVKDKSGFLVTAPSTSPENSYLNKNGERTTVSIASTADMSMIWELFSNCLEAGQVLGVDGAFQERLREAQSRLYPLRIGKFGQLQEWFDDPADYEVQHRHLSHLFGLHPGTRILPNSEPELALAVRKSIQRRMSGPAHQIGWSLAWIVNLYARLGMAEEAYQSFQQWMQHSLTDGGLLGYHAPLSEREEAVFQIDGNFGISAGIGEMLVQSHDGTIHLLPALPEEWSEGKVSGLRARGGVEVGMSWSLGRLHSATIRSSETGTFTLRYRDSRINLTVESGRLYSLTIADFKN